MITTETQTDHIITEADVLARGAQDDWSELHGGQWIALPPNGFGHHIVLANILGHLGIYVRARSMGYVFGAGLIYILKHDARGVRETRLPDVSFIRNARIPAEEDLRRPFDGAPDLAIEVMSPDDKSEDVLVKIHEYFEAGTEQVWVAYPVVREVHQYRRDQPDIVRIYRGADVIDAEALFPGLVLTAAQFFARPLLAAQNVPPL